MGLAQGLGPLAWVGREALGVLFWAVLSQTARPPHCHGREMAAHVLTEPCLGSPWARGDCPHFSPSLLSLFICTALSWPPPRPGARGVPAPTPPGLLLLQRRAPDSAASRVIANWGEKGPDCLAGPEERRGRLKEPEKVASFAQQLPLETFADYVSAGGQGARAEGRLGSHPPRALTMRSLSAPRAARSG